MKDKSQRYLKDFVKVGRSGSSYYVYGAPEDMKGPYDTPQEAEKIYNQIIDNYKDFEVINRRVQKKGQ